MEAMAERENVGVDSVPRRSKHGIPHHTFGVPIEEGIVEIESKSNGERRVEIESRSVGEEEEEGEGVNGEESNGSLFGGSHQGMFLGQNEGSETPNGLYTMEHQLVSDLLPAKNNSDHIVKDISLPKRSYPETDHKYLEFCKNEITSIFSTATSKTSNGDHGIAVNSYSNGTIKPDASTVLEELKEDIPEFDVEKVLNKQETHDLFCPNCNSSITKRVILRRRKRKIQEISPSEEIGIPEPVQNPSPPEHERIDESIQDKAFRCLSCFSIFIPIGRGFKLFTFGGRDLKETICDAPQPTTSDAPASVPAVENGETGEEQHVGVVSVQEQIPLNSQPELLPEEGVEPSLLPFSKQENKMAVDADIKPQLTKVSMALPAEQTLPMKVDADGGNKLPDAYNISDPVIAEKESIEGQKEELQILIHKREAPAVPSTLDPHKDVMGIEKIDTGKQVVVSVLKEPDQTVVSMTLITDASPETEPLLPPGTNSTVPSAAPAAARAGGDSQLDIIKSIAYGGLLESIASLSVVTSAAGANAKTLNIVSLGAANMFGGLFILAHNLRVLKHETSNERYEEVLGRPGHFTLHSAVAVISYLVFGLMPPVIYGFTFRESDNRDYKLIAVASASLLCILLLALGKAYTRTQPKAYMKTLVYYIGLWVMVCGVSYVAGDLLDLLLQKLGLFESSSSVAMPVPQGRPLKTPWASY